MKTDGAGPVAEFEAAIAAWADAVEAVDRYTYEVTTGAHLDDQKLADLKEVMQAARTVCEEAATRATAFRSLH